MQNLYARLGIEPAASESEIAACARQHPELQDRAAILLDAERRAVYDRAHANLKLIDDLRRRLHLDSGDSWFARNHADFVSKPGAPVPTSPMPVVPAARPATDHPPVSAPRARPEAAPDARAKPAPARLSRLVIGIIAALAALTALAYFWVQR